MIVRSCILFIFISISFHKTKAQTIPWYEEKKTYLDFQNDNSSFTLSLFQSEFLGYHNAFAPADILVENNNGWILKPSLRKGSFKNTNKGFISADITTAQISYQIGPFTYGIGHGIKYQSSIIYPQGLGILLSEGNSAFIETPSDIGLNVNYQSYHGVFFSLEYSDTRFKIQSKLYHLTGNEFMDMPTSTLYLESAENIYTISGDIDYEIRSSSLFRYRNVEDIDYDLDVFRFPPLFSGNHGLAIDFDFTYKVNEATQVSIEVCNLGFINWNKNLTHYERKGGINYSGVDVIDLIASPDALSISDSLFSILDLRQIESLTIRSSLPSRIKLGSQYRFNEQHVSSAYLSLLQFSNARFFLIRGDYYYHVHPSLILGLNLTFSGHSFTNLGGSMAYQYQGLRVFISSANLLGISNLLSTKLGGVSIGLSYKF